jgi:ABC-type uncharacterized transport system substrate-binding protein
VPELGVNLLSLYALNEKGLNTVFSPTDYLIRKGKTIIAHGSYQRKMPVFQARYIEPDATALYIEKDPIIWHERLGHIGEKVLRELPNAAIGCEFNKSPGKTDNCEICIKAKMTTNISREPTI